MIEINLEKHSFVPKGGNGDAESLVTVDVTFFHTIPSVHLVALSLSFLVDSAKEKC